MGAWGTSEFLPHPMDHPHPPSHPHPKAHRPLVVTNPALTSSMIHEFSVIAALPGGIWLSSLSGPHWLFKSKPSWLSVWSLETYFLSWSVAETNWQLAWPWLCRLCVRSGTWLSLQPGKQNSSLYSIPMLTYCPVPKVRDFSRHLMLGVSKFMFGELLLILFLLLWIIPVYTQK